MLMCGSYVFGQKRWNGRFLDLKKNNDNNVIESLRSRYYNLHCGLLYRRDDLLAAGREK